MQSVSEETRVTLRVAPLWLFYALAALCALGPVISLRTAQPVAIVIVVPIALVVAAARSAGGGCDCSRAPALFDSPHACARLVLVVSAASVPSSPFSPGRLMPFSSSVSATIFAYTSGCSSRKPRAPSRPWPKRSPL